MIPARYAQSAPSRKDWRAPAMIWLAYCGYLTAVLAALENDLVNSDFTLLFTDDGTRLVAADAYPAVSRAPKIDCMMAPPRSRWRSAVPEAMPARRTGTEPVSECDAGVPAKPTPTPTKAWASPTRQ